MSRHAPLITKKEIIYRRSFIDDHNDRFDNVLKNSGASSPRRPGPERPQNTVISHSYHSDVEAEYQFSKINKKLDRIIEVLRNPPAKKTVEEHAIVDNVRQEQTRQYRDVCDRLEKLEVELTGKQYSIAPIQNEIAALTTKVHELAKAQEDLHARLTANHVAGEDIDELLKIINETRLDMEEKIGNIKHMSDGNYIHLEDKLDGYLRNQHGIQLQVDTLMSLLTHSSRPASVADRHSLSRTSSKSSSVKPTLVVPTPRSPPPKTPSEASYTSTQPKSERSASRKSNSTMTSSNTIGSVASSVKHTKAVAPQQTASQVAPPKPSRSYEVLVRTQSIETLNKLYNAEKENTSLATSSSGSYIAPLVVNERRNSQPATIFLTKKN